MDIKSFIAPLISAVVVAVLMVAFIGIGQDGSDGRDGQDGVGVPGVNLQPIQGDENTILLNLDTDYTLGHFESNSVVFASTTNGTTTLPSARDGLIYTFQISQAMASGNWIIDSAEGDNINGTLHVANGLVACVAEDQINFISDGETIGDWVTLRSEGTQWLIVNSLASSTGKLTCTDPT